MDMPLGGGEIVRDHWGLLIISEEEVWRVIRPLLDILIFFLSFPPRQGFSV